MSGRAHGRTRRGLGIAVAAAAWLALAAPAGAVKPDEILPDPSQEARARAISAELRCMVCQNESIDDSNAELARDLRLLVRERIKAGDSDRQVIDFLVARYGEFVLLRPVMNWRNALLWGGPFAVVVIGGVVIWRRSRRMGAQPVGSGGALSADEQRALEALLRKDG